MGDENIGTVVTADDVIAAFSGTIFWNCIFPWPGNRDDYPRKEDELPLVVKEGPADDEGNREVRLRFEDGESAVLVATMHPANQDLSGEGYTSDADVDFIANLPIFIPALLRERDELRSALRKTLGLLERLHDGQALERETLGHQCQCWRCAARRALGEKGGE